jgi:predicted NBD/HSP70 family sugar kinase
MKLHLYVVSVLALALLFVPRLWAQDIQADTVLKAREAALAAGNLDAILNLFADDVVVVTSSGRFLIGKEQVRGWVQDQVDRRQREEAGSRYISGNKLSWAGKVHREDWHKLGVSPLDVTQDAIIQGDKIRFFNTTFTPESAARLQAARQKN